MTSNGSQGSNKSINWKRAKKDLEIVDKHAARPAFNSELLNRKGAADRTLYHRNYYRQRKRDEVPDEPCPFCRSFFVDRKKWRWFDEMWICVYCSTKLHEREVGVKYYVEYTQIIHFLAQEAGPTDADLCRWWRISRTTLDRIMKREIVWVSRGVYTKMRRGWQGFRFARNISRNAPPDLKKRREEAGWTMQRAADYLGLTEAQYKTIEHLEQKIKPGELDHFLQELANEPTVV